MEPKWLSDWLANRSGFTMKNNGVGMSHSTPSFSEIKGEQTDKERIDALFYIKKKVDESARWTEINVEEMSKKLSLVETSIVKIASDISTLKEPLLEAEISLSKEEKHRRALSTIFMFILTLLFIALVLAIPTLIYFYLHSEQRTTEILTNLLQTTPVLLVLPICVMFSFFVVLLLRTTQGPIVFEAVGFKFQGASGPIILWVICFLTLVSGVHLIK